MFERIIPKVCLWSGEDNTSLSIEPEQDKKGAEARGYFTTAKDVTDE